jgi:hypothetical protein
MNPDQTPQTTEVVPTFTKHAIRHYNALKRQIHADVKTIASALLRLSKNLKEIRDKQLYFIDGHSTFQEFCQKEIGQSRQQVYRLIQAHDIMQQLLDAGVPLEELPEHERMCRVIREELKPEQRAPVWKALVRACKENDDEGRPTIQDVRTAARRRETISETRRREQGEVVSVFERASNVLRCNIAFDRLDEQAQHRLMLVLTEIAESVTRLIRALDKTIQKRGGDDNE